MASGKDLNVVDFDGVVHMKDWWVSPFDGKAYRTIAGVVSVLEVKEAIGFDPGKSEANWVARVEGQKTATTIAGCQIRGITSVRTHGDSLPDLSAGDVYQVP